MSQERQLKQKIEKYRTEKIAYVVDFVSDLLKKKDSIEGTKVAIHKFLHKRHISELIENVEEKATALTEANKINLGNCKWDGKSLYTSKLTVNLNTLIDKRHTVVIFFQEHSTVAL